MNKVDTLEACESTCHECTLKDGVENYQKYMVVEKEKFIKKKDMGNNKIRNLGKIWDI